MSTFIQQIFNGFMLGSQYALVGLGMTLVFGIMRIPNYAHGSSYMLASYVLFSMHMILGISYWPSVLIAVIILALFGFVIEKLVYRPIRGKSTFYNIIAGIGLMMMIENGVRMIWGPEGKRIDNPYPGQIEFMGIITNQQRVIVIVVTVVMVSLLIYFIKNTITGSTIEAVAQNREGAALMGISVEKVYSITFMISMASVGIAACLVAPIFMINTSMGSTLGMKSFVIVIMGGLGSIPGAIAGGYILGLVEAFGAGYISAAYQNVYGFIILIIVIAIRPTGLFGKEITKR